MDQEVRSRVGGGAQRCCEVVKSEGATYPLPVYESNSYYIREFYLSGEKLRKIIFISASIWMIGGIGREG